MAKFGALIVYYRSYWPSLVHFLAFMYKRTLFALSLVLLVDNPFVQLCIYCIDEFGDLLFLALVRPYKLLYVNLVAIFNELLCFMSGLFFISLL